MHDHACFSDAFPNSGRQLVGWILGVGLICGLVFGSVKSIKEAKQSVESIEEHKKGALDPMKSNRKKKVFQLADSLYHL